MELLRPCLFFYLLAILLSLSISSTTNSDPTNTAALQWKGGEGVKRSRVRRQNLNLQHALRLPEKAYVFYMLWRLLNEVYNDTNPIQPLTMSPDKLEFKTSEGPQNMEFEVKPSSTPIQEQSTHSIGMTSTNDSTAIASFPTGTALLASQKTTQLDDIQLAEQSTQRLQTIIQKIIEPNQAIERHIPDSTTAKIFSTAAEEPSTIGLDEQIDHFTGINSTNSTSMESFLINSLPDSQETAQSRDSQLVEQTFQHDQTTDQKIIEPSEVTEQHILDSTLFPIKISSKVEEPSSIVLHEQIDHFTGINGTNSTSMESFLINSLPDSQETSQSRDSQLDQSAHRFQNTKQKIIEPSEVTEQHIIDSTLLQNKISSEVEEPSSTALHEQINHFTGINGTKSTSTASLLIDSLPDSKETSQSRDSQLVDQSAHRFQTTKQKITEPSEVTEQHILDSTTFPTNISSKVGEKTSSIALHEQIDHFTGFGDTTNSTAVFSFPISPSLSYSQKTQSGNSELDEESTHKIPEPITRSIGIIGINDSKDIKILPTDRSLQDSQKNTQSGSPQLSEYSTQHFQSPKQKITKPSQKIKQPSLLSTLEQATAYGIQQETPLQSAMDPHIQNNAILASTVENDNLKPTSLSQMTNNKQLKITQVINRMVKSISKPSPPARKKQTTLSTDNPEIIKHPPHTLSVTWQNGKSNWLVTATDRRVSKHTPPKFTLKQQIQDSTSLLLTEDSPNSDISESTSDPEHHKPKTTQESIDQHTEKNTTNRAKSSRDSLMQSFMTTKTHRQTNDTLVSSKMDSTSPLPILTGNHLVDSKGPEDTSMLTGISLEDTTSFILYRSNAKTQSLRKTNKYTVLDKITSHTSFPLVKDTSTQAPTDGVRSSQTIPVSTEKHIMIFTPSPKPSEKHIHSTSVMRHETGESQSDSINEGPTADSMPKQNYTSNDLLTEMDVPTQSTSGHKPSRTTHIAITRTVSRKPKTFILPTHKSANTAIEDNKKTRRDIFGLLFTFVCLMLLIIVILLQVIWRRWQARHRGSNMWVAGPPLLWGTYHSVLQNTAIHTAIQIRKENSQKNKQENSDVHETIALKQQHKDLV